MLLRPELFMFLGPANIIFQIWNNITQNFLTYRCSIAEVKKSISRWKLLCRLRAIKDISKAISNGSLNLSSWLAISLTVVPTFIPLAWYGTKDIIETFSLLLFHSRALTWEKGAWILVQMRFLVWREDLNARKKKFRKNWER